MKLRIFIYLFAVVFSISLFAQNDLETTTLLKVGDAMPSFTCKALTGGNLSSENLKGKVVLINFWATWCGPCKTEMPLIQKELFESINDKNFLIVTISRGEEAEVVKKFIDQFNYTFPIYLDKEAKVYNLFATKYIPRNFVVGKDGKIKFSSIGFSKEEFEKLVTTIKTELAN